MWLTTIILASLLAPLAIGRVVDASVAADNPQPMSQTCVAWHLSASNVVGQGWIFSAFCKNSKDVYGWDDHQNLDDCVGVDGNGQLTHEADGMMSHSCAECNDADGWGHTSSSDHTLICNCTNSEGNLVQSSIDLDLIYGYLHGSIVCQPTHPAKPRRAARTLKPRQHNDASPVGTWTPAPAPDPTPGPLSNGGLTFSSKCSQQFDVEGNTPLEAPPDPNLPYVASFSPKIMWTQCANNQGVWANTSIDLGLCFGNSHGFMVPQDGGMFDQTCIDCVQALDVVPISLLCHCEGDPVFNQTNPYNASTITIEPTIYADSNGVLGCWGYKGQRGLTPPSSFHVEDWVVPTFGNDDYNPSARIERSAVPLNHASEQQLSNSRDLRTDEVSIVYSYFYE